MNLKKVVGYKAAEFIESGMTVGLGTGTTAAYLVEALGKRVAEENLDIICVTTSKRTSEQAASLSIPLTPLENVDHIDLTIDGADEISADFQGIKGGGGAHLFEKIVASNSNKNMWIVDKNKLVPELGAFPLPIEVVKFGSGNLYSFLEKNNLKPAWRLSESNEKFITDDDNYIIDLHLGKIKQPRELAAWLEALTGVVEHGLFLDTVDTIIVGSSEGSEVIQVKL